MSPKGRNDIKLHEWGTTTGCIAASGFECDLKPLIEKTRNKCCKNRDSIPIEVWYEMQSGNSGPSGNSMGSGDDPHYHPSPGTHVVPPNYPKAIPVDDSNDSVFGQFIQSIKFW